MDFESLIEESGNIFKLLKESRQSGAISTNLLSKYMEWYIAAREIIKIEVPDKLTGFDECYERPGRKQITKSNYGLKDLFDLVERCPGLSWEGTWAKATWLFNQQVNLLKAVRSVTESKKLDRINSSSLLEQISECFHEFAIALRTHPRKRLTLQISDEYDIQYLLYAILKLFFDDIRREEWSPIYLGSANKMDFLLKKEGIGIETKITTSTHKDKQIGEELIIDIPHYKEIKGCSCLWCLIYDPGSNIRNRVGLLDDLRKMSSPDFDIIPVISP